MTEAEATHRAIRKAEIAGAPVYFVHPSCTEALEQVQSARSRQNYVYAETCPHYLTLDDSMYDQEGFEVAKYVLTPPLRNKGEGNAGRRIREPGGGEDCGARAGGDVPRAGPGDGRANRSGGSGKLEQWFRKEWWRRGRVELPVQKSP